MDIDPLTLLGSVLSDEKHKQKMAELFDQLAKIEAAQKQLTEMQERHRKTLAEAQEHRRAGEDALAAATAKEAEVAREREGVASIDKSLTDEKARWEKIRNDVTAEHERREADLKERESRIGALEADLAARRENLDARGADICAREEKIAAIHENLKRHVEMVAEL